MLKMTEIVYRVQNKNGEGYLKCKEKWQCSKDYTLKDKTDRFINPFTDKDLKYYVCDYPEKVNPFIYGFRNKKDLYTWFRMNELIALNFYGFDIYEIKVKIKNNNLNNLNDNNNIIYGNRQLIFNKNFIVEEKLGNINLHYKEFNEIYKNDIEKLFYKEFNFCDCNDCKKPNLNLNLNINENNENINGNNQNNIIWNSDYNDSSSEYDSD
jgi:hypothetical protein